MSDNDGNYSSGDDENPNDYYDVNYFDYNEEFGGNKDYEKGAIEVGRLRRFEINTSIKELIKNTCKLGLQKEDAFVKICDKIATLATPSKDDAIQWFNGWEPENLNPRYLALIRKISGIYFSNASSFSVNYPFAHLLKFIPGSSRYEIGVKFSDPVQVVVFDHFHGQKRRFKFVEKNPGWYKLKYGVLFFPFDPRRILFDYQFHPINSHLILVYNCQNVSLIQLDYENEECWISSQKSCDNIGNFLLDNDDVSKFVFFGTRFRHIPGHGERFDMTCSVQFGQILPDGSLEINAQERIPTQNRRFFCPKLNGNVLSVFEPIFENEQWELHACDLIGKDFKRKFNFYGTQNVGFNEFNPSTKFAWFEEECFVLTKNNKNKNCLYSLNILTQMCKMIYMNFPIVSSLYFDLDGNLATKKDDKIAFYVVKKPQKLNQIVWREIQRNKVLYNKAMEQLPINSQIQPFSNLE